MKIINKVTAIPETKQSDDGSQQATGEFLDFCGLIKIALDLQTKSKGASVSEMRVNLAIIEKCDSTKEGGEVEFNSEETTKIRDVLNAHKWAANVQDIVDLHDAITTADA